MHRLLRSWLCVGCLALLAAIGNTSAGAQQPDRDETSRDQARLDAVRQFADNVLAHGRDRWGEQHTPLFADGLNIDTLEPVVWRFDGNEWIISNPASQQHLLRALVALSNLTGDPQYREAAEAAVRHMFDHHQDPAGLLHWGGHQFIDLRSNTVATGFDSESHELKTHHPYYELFWEVDPDATRRMLRAIWNAHIQDWATLDMNRHGPYGGETGNLWDNTFANPPPFFQGRGLTFINAASDLILAAASLHHHAGDRDALEWGLRLAHQYVRARHGETGLGVYQYSQPEKRQEPSDDADTRSQFGDRAARQFGPEFGEIALEGNILIPGRAFEIYGSAALMKLSVAEALMNKDGEASDLLDWTAEGLRAYARHAYDPERQIIRPLLADGTDLTGHVLPRDGYYGRAGTTLEARRAPFPGVLLVSFARAYRLTGDPELRQTLRHLFIGHGLGDIGDSAFPVSGLPISDSDSASQIGNRQSAIGNPTVSDPQLLFAVLELYQREPNPAHLDLARQIGDNILRQRFHNGFFLPSQDHINARFDAVEPLALLALEAAIRGQTDAVPPHLGGSGYIHGQYNGHGRTYDTRVIWNQTR